MWYERERKKEKFSDHVCGDRLPQIDAVLQYHNILFFATEITDDGSCYSRTLLLVYLLPTYIIIDRIINYIIFPIHRLLEILI